MNKLALAVAITASATTSSGAFPSITYHANAQSGKAGNPLASFEVTSQAPTNIWYVQPSAGALVSNKTKPAIQNYGWSNWTFDFSNPAAVSFTGSLYLGDYRTQSYNSTLDIDGVQNYSGVTMSFSGVGSFNEQTNRFTYSFMNNTVNGGGASVYSQTGPATCVNGRTHLLGRICTSFASASKAWEGLTLDFVFSEDWEIFAGTLQGVDTSGTGSFRNTTLINWQVSFMQLDYPHEGSNPYPFPIPASAWLFGSALLGLGGSSHYRRRRGRTQPNK